MEFVQSGKYSEVHYDRSRKVFIKTFQPKLADRLRYALRIRPYPGRNFVIVAERLKALGIRVPEVLAFERYRLEMRDVEAPELRGLILDDVALQERYVELIIKLYRDRIHCRGLHTKNFLVKDGELVAIDLDAYKAPRLIHYSGREFLTCLKRSLGGPEAFLYQRIVERLGVTDAP
ncbi:hypothetical protein [Halotalea alkalilenta]|uniref:Toluene tolerance protein n=1 Tax=Halotalea alkalilenta TaxID=376489 RepID=A0A172YI07_9GAMM|nr:hypothetical protein [Halotalea alkalilenta]ANF58806.1 hypothetical protein A5892_16150 [Halotalea alkalilenta]